MKKPILLLQFRTDESLEHERKCILKEGNIRESDLVVINILDKSQTLPKPKDLDKYAAVITGASGQFNVTNWPADIQSRVEKLYPFFDEITKHDFPMLALCFGHQLFARLYGGKVESDKNKAETGTFKITLNKDGQNSVIFKGCPENFYACLGHKDSVTKLPKNAVLLASSERCKNQAYRIKNNIFSTQFHPELDRDALTWRIALYPEYMKGRTIEEVKAAYKPIPHAGKVIENFVDNYK